MARKRRTKQASRQVELIRQCAHSDVRLMTAYRLHFEQANLTAVQAVRQGKLGDPRVFSTFCCKLASFTVSFGAEAVATYQLVGTEGSLSLDNAYEYKEEIRWELTSQGKSRKGKVPQRDQIAPELLAFSDCILEGREPEPDGWEGLADVRIITALYESARTGQPVKLPPFDKARRPQKSQEMHRPSPQPPEPIHAQAPTQ